MREAFAVQKLLTFFQQKLLAYFKYQHLNFNETLTNNVISFEQPSPGSKYLLPTEKLISSTESFSYISAAATLSGPQAGPRDLQGNL